MNKSELKEFLDDKVLEYNNPKFIESDPIQIPHKFSLKEDIEIAAFLTSTIAWGNRKIIIKNANKMMDLMGNSPYDFVMNHKNHHLNNFDGFVHRTFNSTDFKYFIASLQNIYKENGGLEVVFEKHSTKKSTQMAIHHFKKLFLEIPHEKRISKHIADPLKASAAKRINMLIRLNRIANRNI